MSLDLQEGAQTEGLPTITLGGKSYFVGRARLEQRIEIALLMRTVVELGKKLPKVADPQAGLTPEQVAQFYGNISRDDYFALVDIIVLGLTRLYPTVTRADILADEDIETSELLSAWPVVVNQAASRRPPAGEA